MEDLNRSILLFCCVIKKQQTKKYSLRKLFRSKSSSKTNDDGPADALQGAPPQGPPARSVSRTSSSGDSDAGLVDPSSMLANVPTADLDLVQYIVGHGILRRDLRLVYTYMYVVVCMYAYDLPKSYLHLIVVGG